MKKEPTMTMSIKVPLSLKLQIEMAANKDGRTINSLVNKVLKDFIEAKKNRRAFRSPILYNFFFSKYNHILKLCCAFPHINCQIWWHIIMCLSATFTLTSRYYFITRLCDPTSWATSIRCEYGTR